MPEIAKKFVAILMTMTLILIPLGSAALAQDHFRVEDRSAEMMFVDIFLARPLGMVATILGSALFVVSLPFSAAGGNTREVYQKMVVEPARYTFLRPVGDI